MVKRQRLIWLDDLDWKFLLKKVKEQGFEGKGRVERFMEKVCRENVFFIRGEGKITILLEPIKP